MKTSSQVLSIRLDTNNSKRLDKLAKATQRTKSFLAAEAVRSYLDLNEWQVDEIRAGVIEAERGQFAKDAEVRRTFARLRKRYGG